MALGIIESSAVLGAEITGVDLTRPVDDATFEQIRRAFHRYEVIFFRGCEISDADHIRFSSRFGGLRALKPPIRYERHRDPKINVVSNVVVDGKHIGSADAGMFWHTDGPFYPNPHAASMLRALEVPMQDGRALGDTIFASVTAAYDALPEAMKKRLDGLQALHSHMLRDQKTALAGRERDAARVAAKKDMEAVHPVVRLHPVTGRRCLYVSDGYTARILGLPEDESRDLIAELTAHCIKPQFLYRHNWRVHDLIMWDNCSTQHKATFDYALPQRRLMHRTTITSDMMA